MTGVEALVAPFTPRLSLRSNFAWVLAGNVAYAGCQWGMIVALTKLGDAFMIGQFSLGLAIAVPVLMFTNLNLRTVQATDAHRIYSFAEYLRLRMLTTTAALAMIGGIVWFGNYERGTALVILAVAAAKGIETLSDIHYGLFQLNDRLDQIARSMMLRGALSLIALAGVLYLTRSVVWGCAAIALVWLAALLLFDMRNGRRFEVHPQSSGSSQWTLLRVALPLGIVTTLSVLNFNMPRYFIHTQFGETQLGIFSALTYATVATSLVGDALGQSAIPRMSRAYAAGEMAEFRSLLLKLVAANVVVGLGGLVAAKAMGSTLLTLVYSHEYAIHANVFVWMMLAAAIHCVASAFTCAIAAARYFRIQVPLYGLVVGANALACVYWVPAAGLTGGAAATVVASVVQLVLGAAFMGYMLSPNRRLGATLRPRACTGELEPGI